MSAPKTSAFTLIELLVVISIIAILAGMLMSGISIARNAKTKAETLKVMKDISVAVSQYLADHPLLGDSPSEFAGTPWVYLHRRPAVAGKTPYLEMRSVYLGVGSPPVAASAMEADFIIDPYGEPLQWSVTNAVGVGGRSYTARIEMRSTKGTAQTADDFILVWDHASAQWSTPSP